MQLLVDSLEQYGLLLAFLLVLVEQLGLPLPAYPVMMVAAALGADDPATRWQVLGLAVLACLVADVTWYTAGRRFGRTGLRTLCRLSLSPDSCVRQTESIYGRWGPPSLLVAKFVPGFAAVATLMAGVLRTRRATFLVFDALGAAMWAGGAVALGTVFSSALTDALDTLEAAGRWGLAAVLGGLALFVAVKWTQRHQLIRRLRMTRISIDELRALLDAGTAPLVVDVRSRASRAEGAIPGSRWVDAHALAEALRALPRADEVVVYCACPNEASAAAVARQLERAGFTRVRPLQGGIDAWIAPGLPVERAG